MVKYLLTSQLNTVRAKEAGASQQVLSLVQKFFKLPLSLGTRPAPRIAVGSLFGWLVTPSIASRGDSWGGSCFIYQPKRRRQVLEHLPPPKQSHKEPCAMPTKNIPQSRGIVKFDTLESILNFPTPDQPESPTDSPQPEQFNLALSADIDEARYNVELLKEAIIENGQALLYWQSRLQTLENQIPSIQNHLIGQLENVLANIK